MEPLIALDCFHASACSGAAITMPSISGRQLK
jgi:hypothetical protein